MPRCAGCRPTGAGFSVSGGLPLGKRAPQRQAYRLVELRRFSAAPGPAHEHPAPKYFPVAGDDAARLIIAVVQHDGADAALALCVLFTAPSGAGERDIASADPGQPAGRVWPASRPAGAVARRRRAGYAANNQQAAIDAGVFGAPSYVIDGEIFWGQDRLDFVERKLKP